MMENRKPPQPGSRLPSQAKAESHTQFSLPPQVFDNFNSEIPTQESMGSKRGTQVQEAGELHSSNFKMVNGVIVRGWRLTRRGLETVPTGVFPPGSLLFADIQDIAANRILGRITGGSGVIEELTAANVKTILALVAADISNFNEAAEDAVGNILGDSNTIDFTYDDGTDSIVAEVKTSFATSGVYTPTRSAEVNMDSNVTMSEAQYMRIGNTVTVSGRFTADPTAAIATSFEITLPIASNLGAAEDTAGVAFCGGIAGQGAEIIGVAANNTAKVQWVAVDVTSQTWSYTFTYQII